MLIGNMFYYRDDSSGRLRRLRAGDDGTPEDAEDASRAWPTDYVQWLCTNGDRRDVRWYLGGQRLPESPLTSTQR